MRGIVRRLAPPILSLALLVGLGEVAARAYWWLAYDIPPDHAERVLEAVYPELADAREALGACPRGCLRILLLGGSVLHPDWTPVSAFLRAAFADRAPEIRVAELAIPAHTSRDSLLKYRAIDREPTVRSARFDLVVFYQGINEARANNVPPERFRLDYGHYGWYQRANALARAPGPGPLVLPATVAWSWALVSQAVAPGRYVPVHLPREEWLRYGADIRSAEAFRANLEGIAGLAEKRGELLATATFATWVPPDYSLERFEAGELDYRGYGVPVELWGRVENVLAAVEEHNRVLLEVAHAHPEIAWVDLAAELPGGARFFRDICHLSPRSSAYFVARIVEEVGERIGPGSRGVAPGNAGAG